MAFSNETKITSDFIGAVMLGRGTEPIFLESDRNPTLLVNINVSKSTLSLIIKSGSYLVSEREIFTPSNQYPYCSRNAVL